MELSEKIVKDLKSEIEFYTETLVEVGMDIQTNNISEYPVFIAHQGTISFGESILNHEDFGKQWSINATFLEELIRVGLVTPQGEDQFKSAFKDPEKFFCILLVTDRSAHFIFAPIESSD